MTLEDHCCSLARNPAPFPIKAFLTIKTAVLDSDVLIVKISGYSLVICLDWVKKGHPVPGQGQARGDQKKFLKGNYISSACQCLARWCARSWPLTASQTGQQASEAVLCLETHFQCLNLKLWSCSFHILQKQSSRSLFPFLNRKIIHIWISEGEAAKSCLFAFLNSSLCSWIRGCPTASTPGHWLHFCFCSEQNAAQGLWRLQ